MLTIRNSRSFSLGFSIVGCWGSKGATLKAHSSPAPSPPFLPFSLQGDERTSSPTTLCLSATHWLKFTATAFLHYGNTKSGARPQRWHQSMDPRTPRKLFLAPAHSQENTTYRIEHSTMQTDRVTFQPAAPSPSPRTQSKTQEETRKRSG